MYVVVLDRPIIFGASEVSSGGRPLRDLKPNKVLMLDARQLNLVETGKRKEKYHR